VLLFQSKVILTAEADKGKILSENTNKSGIFSGGVGVSKV